MKLKQIAIGLSLVFLTSGCSFFGDSFFGSSTESGDSHGNGSSNIVNPDSGGGAIIDSSNGGTTPPSNEITFDDFFSLDNLLKIDIHISDEELQKIQSDYEKYSPSGLKSPIYRRADEVVITISKNDHDYRYTFDDVGVRMRGNTSRTNFINDDNEIYTNIHLKLSFEETFDDPLYYEEAERMTWSPEDKALREDRKFLGMSKLDLRFNKCLDRSFIREHYALEMFRAFGIMSQHSNFGQVVIHQDEDRSLNYGLYLVTEPLSKTFIKRTLQSNDSYINMRNWSIEKTGTVGVAGSNYGQLYKASYGIGKGAGVADMTSTSNNLFGIEPDDASYLPAYELKTNKDNGGDHTLIKAMIQTLLNNNHDRIAEVIDLEYFAMYEAVATLLGDPDDLRNNYNNYGMYFRRTDGKMVIIPIDQDRVLGVSRHWDPTGNAMSRVEPFSTRAEGAQNDQRNRLYTKTILANTTTQAAYKAALQKIIDSDWVKMTNFEAMYQKVKGHYESISNTPIYSLDWTLDEQYDGENSNMSFRTYIERKVAVIKDALGSQGDGGDPTPLPSDNIIKDCTNFYLRGTMSNDGWNTLNYKFQSIGEGLYQYDYQVDRDNLEFKIYCTDGSTMWLRAENGELLTQNGGNVQVTFTSEQKEKTMRFIINTTEGTLSWSFI